MEKPQPQQYILNNWQRLKELNIKYFEDELQKNCLPYDRKKLSEWFRQKKSTEKKKGGRAFGRETYGSKSTIESMFAIETPEQKQARKEAQTLLEAEPHLKSLATDQGGRKETKIQNAAIFEEQEESKHDIGKGDDDQFNSPSHSQESNSSGEKSKVPLRAILRLKTCWKEIKLLVKAHSFKGVKSLLKDYESVMSFLVQVRKVRSSNPELANTLSFCLQWLQDNRYQLPIEIAEDYRSFFEEFEVQPANKDQDMVSLFKLCRGIKAEIMWVTKIKRPYILFENSASLHGCAAVVQILLQQKNLYSLSYFDFIDFIIQNPLLSEGVNGLLLILNSLVIKLDLKLEQALLQISNYENSKYGRQTVQHFVTALLQDNEANLSFSSFLIVLEVALENQNIQDTKLFMGSSFNNKEELKQLMSRSMEADAKHVEQQTKLAKENQIKKDLADKQKVEDKKKEETEKKARAQKKLKEREQYIQDIVAAETQFKKANTTDLNQFKSKELQVLFESNLKELSQTMKVILGKLKLKLRAEQVIVMNLLLRSNKKFTFIQLGTGFGKSRSIIGPLADATRWATGAKSITIVPTKILRATNQDYCIAANQAEIEITDPNCIGTFYCTYDQFLRLQHMIPADSNIFVDEGHIYFKEKVINVEGKAVVPPEILKKFARVFILSATFGGQQGIAELQRYLKDSLFIYSPADVSQKDLSKIEVFGNMQQREDILAKAVEIAKLRLKEYPVILFCKDDAECEIMKSNFECARIFGEKSDTAQLLDIIAQSKKISKKHVTLTTQKACIGIDFIFQVLRAFVILTEDANYLEELLQPIGRSSRVDINLPLLGVILTSIDCQDIASLENSLKDKAAEIKLFGKTARFNMSILNICPPATQKQQKKLQQVIDVFNNNPSNNDIKKELQSLKGFKEPIEEHLKQMNKEMLTSMITEDTSMMEVQSLASLLELYQICGEDIVLAEDSDFNESIALGKRHQRNDSQYHSNEHQVTQMKRLKLNKEQLDDVEMKEEEQEDQQQPSIDQKNHSNRATELNQQMDQPSEFEMDPEALKQKEITEAKDVLGKYGIKTLGEQDQAQIFNKPKSILSFNTNGKKAKTVCGERGVGGRFKQKYKTGEKTASGCIIKEVDESNWKELKKDDKGNRYYKCVKCNKEDVRKDNRNKHTCRI